MELQFEHYPEILILLAQLAELYTPALQLYIITIICMNVCDICIYIDIMSYFTLMDNAHTFILIEHRRISQIIISDISASYSHWLRHRFRRNHHLCSPTNKERQVLQILHPCPFTYDKTK